ncbi:MAG: PASTA domain-containing protein [Chitinivibrionales bacterium]|nr:PASTA domain-containing protein [Chitinivibrionales bacterium]
MKKNYTISVPVKTFWSIILPLAIVVAAIGTIAGVLIVDRLVMPGIVSVDKGIVKVPEIRNLEYEHARQKLFDIGLRMQVTSKDFSTEVAEGCVIMQQPEAGVTMDTKERRGVQVALSKGPEVRTVPDLGKITEHHAKRELRKHGFSIGNSVGIFSSVTPKDHVIAISPESGSEISRETPIQLTVSRGERPTHAVVPNVIGEMLSTAKAQILESGLKVGRIEPKYTTVSRPGRVISQSISPGNSVPFERAVNMIVATRKK